jgi:hypothetical protein
MEPYYLGQGPMWRAKLGKHTVVEAPPLQANLGGQGAAPVIAIATLVLHAHARVVVWMWRSASARRALGAYAQALNGLATTLTHLSSCLPRTTSTSIEADPGKLREPLDHSKLTQSRNRCR